MPAGQKADVILFWLQHNLLIKELAQDPNQKQLLINEWAKIEKLILIWLSQTD